MYQRNVELRKHGPSRLKRMASAVVRGLTWFAHRSDGVMYDDDFPNEFERAADRRTFSRLPGAELSEEQRQQAIEDIRRRLRIG